MITFRKCLSLFLVAISSNLAMAVSPSKTEEKPEESGSGSNASLSILELDDPILGCLLEGAELVQDVESETGQTIEIASDASIWAITFDQSLVEVEFEDEFYFVETESVKTEPCDTAQ